MKNIFLVAILCLFPTTIFAQLSVDSVGNVNICDIPAHPSITQEKYGLRIRHNKPEGLSISSYGIPFIGDPVNIQYGVNSFMISSFPEMTAVNGLAAKAAFGTPSGNVFGLKGISSGGSKNLGVYGHATKGNGDFAAAIYGTTGTQSVTETGTYAGYFNGDVKVTGTIMGTVLSRLPVLEPAESVMHTIHSESDETASSVTEQLKQVDIVRYKRQEETTEGNKLTLHTEDIYARMSENSDVEVGNIALNEEPVETKPATMGYALQPEQLQKVFPELVYEDKEGNFSINYVEMVPLLVQSIRELSAEVTELRHQLGLEKTVNKSKQQTTAIKKTENTKSDKNSTTYDLSGRPIANPQRGIFVKDGKKITVK